MQQLKTAFAEVRSEMEKPRPNPIRVGELAIRLFISVLQHLKIRPREIELLEGQMDYTLHWGQRPPGTDMNHNGNSE